MSHILIIDNDRSVGAAMEYMLRNAGHTCAVGSDAQAGLEALDKSGFDLAFVDMVMPDIDGLAAIKRIHEKKPDLLIVAMTGYRLHSAAALSADLLEAAEAAGAACGLRKPFSQKELLSAANLVNVLESANQTASAHAAQRAFT
jgi:CheY-like chemotaxis protein